MITLTGVVREVLIGAPDPEGLPGDRLAVLVRARWAQLDGDPKKKLSRTAISTCRSQLRARNGGGQLTRQKLLAYQKRVDQSKWAGNGRPPQPNQILEATRVGGELMGKYTVEDLMAAKDFVDKCGGFTAAREVLDHLEKVQL
jgi:hypothetical protein